MAWSPDSKRLAAIRVEPEAEHTVYVIESSPKDQVQPKLHSYQYLKPGDRIAHPRVCLFDIEHRRTIPVADGLFENPWSVSSLRWRADGNAVTFVYNQRGHQVLRVVEVDGATGATRTVVEEASETFVDYPNKQFTHWTATILPWSGCRSGTGGTTCT